MTPGGRPDSPRRSQASEPEAANSSPLVPTVTAVDTTSPSRRSGATTPTTAWSTDPSSERPTTKTVVPSSPQETTSKVRGRPSTLTTAVRSSNSEREQPGSASTNEQVSTPARARFAANRCAGLTRMVAGMHALVTGGAGFIGSNLVDALLAAGNEVTVLDDLSTGVRSNVPEEAHFVQGSVTDAPLLSEIMPGVEVVYHQGALGSVARSVESPLVSDTANAHGTLAVLEAARRHGVRRVVSASSSSVYGGAQVRPTPESTPLVPRSPYAVTKLVGEQYARVYAELHGLETVSLRYFNVYGPRQRPDAVYAAVIPLFITALLEGRAPAIHGDGSQSRDFAYVDDVVSANIAAASAPAERCSGRAFNVAGGGEQSLLELLVILRDLLGSDIEAIHGEPRVGDVRHSFADLTAAAEAFGYAPQVSFRDGLARTIAHHRSNR